MIEKSILSFKFGIADDVKYNGKRLYARNLASSLFSAVIANSLIYLASSLPCPLNFTVIVYIRIGLAISLSLFDIFIIYNRWCCH